MKKAILFLLCALLLFGCAPPESAPVDRATDPAPSPGRIYLYGEAHGQPVILDKEFELWNAYYHEQGMRHLFVELGYYSAEFLNLWMRQEGDELLDLFYEELQGTLSYNPYFKDFYKRIKEECPETVFHGTDVGHQYDTTGRRYLQYLEDNGQKDSDAYRLAEEAIEQGEQYYGAEQDPVYRENTMAENFIRAYDALGGEDIMGIYGTAHTGLLAMEQQTQSVPNMANQLRQYYGDIITTEDLSLLLQLDTPLRVDSVEVAGKTYEASYFGEESLTGLGDFSLRRFWRLEGAYEDFADRPKTGDMLPYDNYLMRVEQGQVFLIEYTMTNGETRRQYYRSDGNEMQGRPTTEEFTVE